MRMHRVIAVAAAVFALQPGAPAHAQQKVDLRFGFATAQQGPGGQAADILAKAAKENSGGTIDVKLFPAAQLGGELEMLSQIRLGTLDMAMLGSGIVAAVEPTFSITELPFIWKNQETCWKTLNGPVGKKILASLEPKGMKGLAWGAWGYRALINTSFEINAPADLKGRRIRVIENPLYVQTIKAFGGSPVPVAWPEVYAALQQKTIDSVETNPFAMAESKLHEVAKNLAVTNHIFSATVYVVNLARFKSLTAAQQAALEKASRAGGEQMYALVGKSNADAIDAMQRAGVKVSRPEPAAFAKTVAPVHKYFATLVGPQLLDEVKASQE